LEREEESRVIQKAEQIVVLQGIWSLFDKKAECNSGQMLHLSNVGNCQRTWKVLETRKVPVAGLAGTFDEVWQMGNYGGKM
jgi:L-asparagine transporter-like permease